MKYSILLLMFLVVSCGKNQSSSSSSGARQEQQRGFIDLSESGTTVPDLLNVTLDVPVEITTDRITFLRNASLTDQGVRHSCGLNVKESEIWHYSVGGNRLNLEMANGSRLNMEKQSSYGTGAQGVWMARASNNGMKMIYRFTLFQDRIILNQDCEG